MVMVMPKQYDDYRHSSRPKAGPVIRLLGFITAQEEKVLKNNQNKKIDLAAP